MPDRDGGDIDSDTATSALGRVQARIDSRVALLYQWLAANRITRVPWSVVQTFSRADGALLSGSMAYYTFLSILPLLLVAGFIAATLSVGSIQIRGALASAIERIAPALEGPQVLSQLIDARAGFGVLGLISVAYAGSGFIGALTAALNRMWRVEAGRNPFSQKLLNLGFVALMSVVLVGSAGATLWVAYLARAAFGSGAPGAVRAIELVGAPLSMFALLLMLYRLLPARPISWRSQIPGALVGTAGIEVLKRAFAFWAGHSAGIGALPRSLFSVVILLIWFGFFAQVVLYGAALNVVLAERDARAVPEDSFDKG
jgi:membrane protein